MNQFLSLIERLAAEQRASGYAEKSLRARRRQWCRFAQWLVEVRHRTGFSELSLDDITEWKLRVSMLRDQRTEMPLRPATMREMHYATRSLCSWLAKNGAMSSSIAQSYSLPRIFRTYRQGLRHAAVRRALLAIPLDSAVGNMMRAMGEVFYSTGIRPCELLRLNLGDVDFETGVVRVLGKGGKERVVPIGGKALRWLTAYQDGVRPTLLHDPREQALWLNFSGRRLSYTMYARWWLQLARSVPAIAGITAYSLRRACATELVRSGAPLSAVQEQLGHEDASHLIHYVRTDLADLKKALARYHPRDREMDDETKF